MKVKDINSFIAIGAHCDDVDLRCGGTFSRLAREGKKGCYVVSVENAYTGSHFSVKDSHEALAIRRNESAKASLLLGAERLEWLEFKSFYFSTPEAGSRVYPSFESLTSLQEELKDVIFSGLPPVANADCFPACRDRLNRLLDEVSPDAVFTHSPDDRHPDHYSLSRFVEMTVRERNIDLYFWEPGSGGPIGGYAPDFFVELSEEDVKRKQEAIDCYPSQFPEGLLSGFAEDRARAYGEYAGVKYAEAFRKGSCGRSDPWKSTAPFLRTLKNGPAEVKLYPLPSPQR